MHDDLAKQLLLANEAFYTEHGDAFADTRQQMWEEERLVAERALPGMTVVDIGAGNGRFTRRLSAGVRYVGIEPSSALRRHVPTGVDIQPGSFPDIPLPDACADIVVCVAVLHHLPSPERRQAAIQELIRLAKPGGLIAASSWFLPSDRPDLTPVEGGDAGDVWVPWHAEGATAKRYVHLMQPDEWRTLWDQPALRIEQLGLFGKQNWTSDEETARNWFVIAYRI